MPIFQGDEYEKNYLKKHNCGGHSAKLVFFRSVRPNTIINQYYISIYTNSIVKERGDKMSTHYFWAIRLPDFIKQNIQDEMKNVKQIFQFKRWVHMYDFHITLAFLGSVDQQQLQHVIDLVGNAIKEEKAFSLQIQGLNIFGNQQTPRIFWAAVHEENKLFQLQKIVHEKCLEAGFTLENRPYHPHITLARKWTGREEFQLGLLEKYNPFCENPLSFQADEVVLYKTNLEQEPKYEPIKVFQLYN